MHNIFLVCTNKIFYKNRIFDLNNPDNRDDCLYPYYLLRQEFQRRGVALNTYDYFKRGFEGNYSLIFHDTPKNIKRFLKKHQNVNKYLLIYESPIIGVANQNLRHHKYFKKIFTWDDRLIDNRKYFNLKYAHKIPKELNFDLEQKKKLCTIIIGHKFKSHPRQLYRERIRAIRWFEKNHPQDFDLYGTGWDRYYFKDNLLLLNRLKFLTKLLKPNYPSYKGTVKSKKETYKKYKFALCYENARGFPGYITEKIFDCFFAGCVPIYLGASNVTDYIPANTFIDKRNFETYEELYDYLKNMSDSEYLKYLGAIKNFIKSDEFYLFSAQRFAQTISDEVLKDL